MKWTRNAGAAVAAAVVGALVGTTLAGPATAADGGTWNPQERRSHGAELWPEQGDDESLIPASTDAGERGMTVRGTVPANSTVDVRWPGAGSMTVAVARAVPGGKSAKSQSSGARADAEVDNTPTLRVVDADVAAKANVAGLLMQVAGRSSDTDAAAVAVSVDYSMFAGAFGGGWGNRLRLVTLPSCALSTPEAARCQTQTPVESVNDAEAGTVTARSASLTSGVMALTASASGSTGDFSATPLAASSAWAVSTQTGSFSWSYPLRVPPAASGLEPDLSLSYSSASVDGRVASTNNQSSWIGDGWDLSSGFVERKYVPCAEDTDGDANNADHKTGDLCWSDQNATLVFSGSSTELVHDTASGYWRPKNDDGTRVERKTGGWNADNDDEYWVVTTSDGVKYYFGRGKTSSTGADLNSAWTVPVYGNNSGEQCHASAFADSWCQQAWRWNLDYVVDLSGNAMTYNYVAESNNYGRNNNDAVSTYDRGGYLARIDYGQRDGASAAPEQVVFTTAERCVASGSITCAPSELNDNTARSWPDVPYDLVCTSSSSCPDVQSPAFFTRKRLAKVETKTTISGALQSVDSWTLTHTLPDPGDSGNAVLWLASIQHQGLVGGTVTLPKVTFAGTQLANRVDKIGDAGPPMIRYRLSSIVSESGGITSVTYSDEDCTTSDLPSSPQTNTRRCFPVQWTPEGRIDPITEYFHKYLVTVVASDPAESGIEAVQTRYDYVGGAAWHYDDNDLLPAKRRTWSDFRGYATVDVTTGALSSTRSKVRHRYFRGMDGDHLPGGDTRDATVDGVADLDAFNGTEREQITYNTGDVEVSSIVNTPWRSSATASDDDGHKAYHSGIAGVVTTTDLAAGGARQTSTSTTFDDTYGTPTQVNDYGDDSTASDNRCTTYSYARDGARNLSGLVTRAQTVAVKCSETPSLPAHVISDTRTFYDGSTNFASQSLTRGLATRVEQVKSYTGSTPTYIGTTTTYDDLGRPTSVTDPLNRKTTTAYSPALASPLTSTTVTTPAVATGAQSTTAQINPAWGTTTSSTDPAGRVTSATFDALGRVTQVWNPDRAQGTDTASTKYSYTVGVNSGGAMQNTISTQVLNAAGTGYATSVQFYDGLLRDRQTQVSSANVTSGGRVVTDTIYDSRGLVAEEKGAWATTGNPATTLVVPSAAVPARTRHVYDGAGRETATIFDVNEIEKWRTTTTYGGDRVTVTPPSGGTPQTKINDARGNTTSLIETTGGTPATNTTTYSYDPAGRMTGMRDPAGNTWSNSFDLLGRQTTSIDPDKGTTTTTYDDAGQVLTTTDSRNKTLTYTYDALGRKTQMSEGSTKLATWVYDTLKKGLPTSSSRWSGTNEYKTSVTAYDKAGRPLDNTVTIPASETGLDGTYKTEYTYMADGQVKTMKYAGLSTKVNGTLTNVLGAETVTTYYDALSNPQWMSGGLGWGAYVAGSTYSSYGEPLMFDLGGGYAQMVNFSYENGTRRLSKMWLVRENVDGYAADVTYTYDNAGNVTSAIDAGTPGKDAQCFSYDGLRRLTQAWTPSTASCSTAPTTAALGGPAPYWKSYSYDAVGNRTKEVSHASAGDSTVAYARPTPGSARPHAVTGTTTTGVGATTSSYGYDATGNMTTRNRGGKTAQALTWNSEGRLATLVEGSSTGSYLYAADGDRLIRNQGGVKTLYLPGQELTYTGPTKAGTAVRYYTFAGTTVASRTTSAADTAMTLINDPQGTSTIAVASKTNTLKQRRFDPFGNARDKTAVTWQGDHTFLDKATDTTGLTQVGARYYDSAIGSFISVDPILALGKPQQWNGYAYAGNNPTTWSDPTGLEYEGSLSMTLQSERVMSQHRSQTSSSPGPAPTPSPGPRPTLPPVKQSAVSTPAWVSNLMVSSYNAAAGLVNGLASMGNAIAHHPGDVLTTALGIYGMIQGGDIAAAGVLALPTGIGTIEGAGAVAIGGSMMVGGALAINQGASSLVGHASADDSVHIMQQKSSPSSSGGGAGDDISRAAENIANHTRDSGHSIPGVADESLEGYVASVMRDNPGYAATRGRRVWWDGDRGSIVIRQGSGGTAFKPDRGYQYFLDQLQE